MIYILKALKFFLIFASFGGGALSASEKSCPFCNPAVIAKQFIHETEHTITLYCLSPATKGNLLIIPKKHIERFDELTVEEMQAVQKEINFFSQVFVDCYGTSEFVIIQKNGKNAGQSVPHLHFHMIPAPESVDKTLDRAFQWREIISDDEMNARIQELQDCFDQNE